MILKCPYCGGKALLKSSLEIYRDDYGYVYVCENYPNCNAYVGTHKKTLKPLGRLANEELRKLKITAHLYFDSLWKHREKQGDSNPRTIAYKWLSEKLNMSINDTHIGYFDKETTEKVIELCKPYYIKVNKVRKRGKLNEKTT